ncbi:MAG: sensor histidine kinase [Spirochaetota bacterium]
MHSFNWRAVTKVFNANYGIPHSAETIHRRWLKRQTYMLAVGSCLVTLIGFPLYHFLTSRPGEDAFIGQYHRLAVLATAGVSSVYLVFNRNARTRAEVFSFANLLMLFICSAVDIALSDKPRRYTAFSLVPLFGSTYVFTGVRLMTIAYVAAAVFFTALNVWFARLAEIIAIYNVAYFAAWWMALIRIRSLQRISYDQARLYERRVYDQRVRLARNLHDSLGGDLMQLSLQLSGNAPREQVLDLAQAVIAKTKNLVYTLEPTHENQHFPDYVSSYVARLRQIGRFEVNLSADSDWPKMPIDKNLNLQAIFTEWMTNALRHSMATHLNICLYFRKRRYFLVIRDNGSGFRWNGDRRGSGLRNIALRAGLLNAKVFARQTGTGTLFFLKGGNE